MSGITYENERNGRRLPVRLPFSVVLRGATIRAESINLSKSGLRLRTDSQLALGETVQVMLLEGKPYPAAARVIWAGPADTDQYEVGLQYVRNSAGTF